MTEGAQIQVFLIADVRGYTRFTQQHGDEAAASLAAKFARVTRQVVQARGGNVTELRGDEALAVFPSAREAVLAAVALQERCVSETIEEPELPLEIGIGIDAGEAVSVEGGHRGGALNLAARLCGHARPGEILASPGVTHLARRVKGVRYLDSGRVHMKNLTEPIEVIRIVPEGAVPVERLREVLRPDSDRHAATQSHTGTPALRGRAREMERIEVLLEGARSGVSGALVIHGALGSGKSALLDHAADLGTGMRVVRAAAVETEMSFAFAGLHAMLLPLLDNLDNIAKEHAQALRAVLTLEGAPSLGRLYVGAATLALLGAAASDRPLLCLVDDAHWLDPASADALRFAARRLDAEGVALMFAAHEAAQPGFLPDGLPDLHLTGLGAVDSLAVLADRCADRIAPPVAQAIVDATGGNPRALVEVPEILSRNQLRGVDPIVGPIPVSDVHRRAIARRLDALSEGAERALVVAAAADTHTMRIVTQADETIAAGLSECEEAGLVELGEGRLVFPDPLVRSAAYQAAPAAARRAAHADLARALESDPLARERRAWHLAAATIEPDEAVASELVVAAATVLARRGHAAAAALFEAAARLSPSRAARDRRALHAARSWWHAGNVESAHRLLQDAGETDDPLLLADARLLRGRMELAQGNRQEASLRLVEGAQDVELTDRLRAAAMFSLACDGLDGEAALVSVRRAVELTDGVGGKTEVAARLAAARRAASALANEEAAQHLARVHDIVAADDQLRTDPDLIVELAMGLPSSVPGHDDLLRGLAEGTIDTGRRFSVMALPHALTRVAWIDLFEGRWDDAAIGFDEAWSLAIETGQANAASLPRVGSALLDALRGRELAALGLLEDLDLSEAAREATEGAILGILELGFGRGEEALEHLARWVDHQRSSLLPPGWCTPVDFVEANHRAGGERLVETGLDTLASGAGQALSAWMEALLDSGPTFRETYDRALRELERVGDRPFMRARIHLNLGERLRRDGLRTEARVNLREAIEVFDALDASGWSERARQELRLTGERVRKRTPDAINQLTAQELHIARLLAERKTYKEIAAMLFLSPKTIEFHASKIYRKLGVTSKNELAEHLKRDPDDTGTEDSE